MKKTKLSDWLQEIMEWENGLLTEEKEIELFQFLLDEGHCWRLQGFYGMRATYLIEAGLIVDKRKAFYKRQQNRRRKNNQGIL
jgi:hypothetical protein